MNATRTIVVMCLLLAGCGSCQHETEPPAGGGGAPAKAPAGALQAPGGKIQVAPLAPKAAEAPPPVAHVESNLTVTPMVPQADTVPGQAPEPNEGDCIVVADANPDYGPPPLGVTFSAEAECGGGQPTYKWSFGDGAPPSSEANPTHTYTKPGDYTASVTATDASGASASDEIDITVEEGEVEPQ
jgi:hypothetical protein